MFYTNQSGFRNPFRAFSTPTGKAETVTGEMVMKGSGSGDEDLERDTDLAIEACGGDARAAVRALLIANAFLESELTKAQAKTSAGYARRGASKRKPN